MTQILLCNATLVDLEREELRPGHQLRLDPHVSDISNLDHHGVVLPREERRRMYSLGDRLWHTDSSFKPVPARYSLLSARAIPSAGGETQFADLRAAYDALPDPIKQQLEGLVAEHSILYSRSTVGFTDFSDEERAALPPVPHRLVRVHPGSKRRTLYLSPHSMAIRGMPVPEARLTVSNLTVVPPGGKAPTLRNVSFDLPPGQALGVIGSDQPIRDGAQLLELELHLRRARPGVAGTAQTR